MKQFIVAFVLLSAGFMLMGTDSAHAAAISVSPAFQDVILPSAIASKDVAVTFTNQSSNAQTFRLSAVDFGSLDESGGVAFLGVPTTELEHRYGLVSWMTIERDSVFIPAAGSIKVVIRIDNRPSLAPGGHYAALLATAIADPGTTIDRTKVNLKQVIASLILVRKEGGAEIGLNAAGFTLAKQSPFELPKLAQLRFQNPGNVHVTPRGTVVISDPAGRIVKKGIINENSDIILPQSFRRIKVNLLGISTAWTPGRYTATSSFRFDGNSDMRSSKITFWYLGQGLVLLIGVVLIILFTTIFTVIIKKRRSTKKALK